ncbi:hypothetical protein FSP39_008731 [Pinctada imbricata]|uniref:Receptor ligand binding region domain-containing protein n=1 Tax=Pinctada imbricata TaxID=66713 RepID=A0AA89C0X2_PINIB|nr:hypothetical protein FSP39_008731 [Pinctada imbricata]
MDKGLRINQRDQWATVADLGRPSATEIAEGVVSNALTTRSRRRRLFVITCYADTLREMLLKAHGLGMTEGDYAFIYYRSFIGDSFGDYSWKRGDSSDQIAMDAYEALLIVTLMKPNTTEFVDFENEVKTAAKDKYGYDYGHYDVNPFVTAYHDAFLIYGDVVNETIADGGDIFDGENITGKMRNRTFDGITGKLRIDENGDRETDFTLLDMDPVSGNYNVVGFYHGSNGVFEWHEVHRIHWPNNAGPPVNMPKCGYTGDAPECQNYGCIK